MDLRKDFFEILCELAEKDKDVIFLTGDLGFSFYEEYAKRFPKQFINCGVAESNMIGVVAGLALGGKKPIVYTCSTFYFRALEQIRDEVCYNKLDVKLVGTGASPFLGFSHNIKDDEDIRTLSNFPNLKIFLPKNKKEIKKALSGLGSAYVRL